MKVKLRNLFEVIIQGLLLVLMIIKPFFVQVYRFRIMSGSIYDPDPKIENTNLSLFGVAFKSYTGFDKARFFVWLLILLSLAGLVFYLIQLLGKGNKRNSVLTVIFSTGQCLALLVLSIMATKVAGEYDTDMNQYGILFIDSWSYHLGWVFIAFAVVLVVLTLITYIGFFVAKKRGIVDEVQNTSPVTYVKEESNLDKIEKLKKLLDSGAITEEEYMSKKKQLLDELTD